MIEDKLTSFAKEILEVAEGLQANNRLRHIGDIGYMQGVRDVHTAIKVICEKHEIKTPEKVER